MIHELGSQWQFEGETVETVIDKDNTGCFGCALLNTRQCGANPCISHMRPDMQSVMYVYVEG